METLLQDVRFALRYLQRRRGLALVAITMLTLGIGATTAMFNVVDGVLLRALPYPAANRLVAIWQTFPHWRGQPALAAQWDRIALSYEEYGRVAALDHDFEGVAAAYWRQGIRLSGAGDTVEVSVARGTASLLPLLGIQPAVGRWFLPGEDGGGAPQLAVLPHALWLSRFGGHADVIGKVITLNDRPFQVIGVLPADFAFTSISIFGRDADRTAIWTPLGSWSGDLTQNSQNYEVIARLRPGLALGPLRNEVAEVIRAGRNPDQHDARILLRQEAETGSVKQPLVILFASVGLLLVITCGNLAALLLGEAATRQPEIRTRLAIGAGHGRIVRQLLTESAVLALSATAFGVPLAIGLSHALVALAPDTLPRAEAIGFDWRVAAFSLVTALGATIAFGVAPALSLARTQTNPALTASRSISARSRTQHFLLAGQIALSTILLIAAGLLVRTLIAEQTMRPGFDANGLLSITLNVPSRASNPRDLSETQRYYADAVAQISALPGVEAVSATSNLPIAGPGGQWAIDPNPAGKLTLTSANVQHDEVLPNFFSVMHIPLLTGRTLNDTDQLGMPLVAVVNETMARQFWPRESAIGKSFLAPNGGVRTIVGIVADIRERGLRLSPTPTFYESLRQVPQSHQTLLIRTTGDPKTLAVEVRQTVVRIDQSLPTPPPLNMTDVIRQSTAPERYRAGLLLFFAGAAILMTSIGISGVAARAIGVQMRELCIRMAVGATAAEVVRWIVLRYVRIGIVGSLLGAAGAYLSLHVAESYLFGVTAKDPLTYLVSGIFLLLSSTLAAWLAARRLRRARIAEEIAAV